ncbi:MAG: hypothetical protein IJA61_04695 [Clostridia bacterium]|nr:hypothetical protein [Clostridia bacterium]
MNEKLKIALWIILGIVGAIAIFSLIVVIGCSVNGLTFGEQVCEWFGGNAGTIADSAEQVAEAIAETPIA